MARTDAVNRAMNNNLVPGDLVAGQPQWIPLLEEARRQMSPAGLGTPAGLEPGGEIWMRHYMVAATGYVKWLIHYRRQKGRDTCTLLGYFPIIIHKDPDSDCGVTVPDLPGCLSGGETTVKLKKR